MRLIGSDRVRGRRDRGASAVEYALIVASVVGALVLGALGLTQAVSGVFTATVAGIEAPAATGGPTSAPSSTPTATSTAASMPTPTPTPTPTPPLGSVSVTRGIPSSPQDVGANNGSQNLTATVTPVGAGAATWNASHQLIFTPAAGAATHQLVTVSYSYKKGNSTITGTRTFRIAA